MNWWLIAAGAVMLAGAGLHGVVGDEVLRKIGQLQLPPTPFGGGMNTRVALRVTWHFGTIAFAVLGAWLVATGLQPDTAYAVGVTYLSGTMLSCYALTGTVIRIYRRGFVSVFSQPGLLILIVAATLTWRGSTSL